MLARMGVERRWSGRRSTADELRVGVRDVTPSKASSDTAALCQIMASAITEIVTLAERSVGRTIEAIEEVAAYAEQMSRDVTNHPAYLPADVRTVKYRARRARLSAQRARSLGVKVAEAVVDVHLATQQIHEITSTTNPNVADLQIAIDDAIKAAIHVDRAARQARLHLWEGASAALDAARIRDLGRLPTALE